MHTDPAGPRRGKKPAESGRTARRRPKEPAGFPGHGPPGRERPADRNGPDRSSACNSIQEGQTADRPRAVPVVPTFGNRIPGRRESRSQPSGLGFPTGREQESQPAGKLSSCRQGGAPAGGGGGSHQTITLILWWLLRNSVGEQPFFRRKIRLKLLMLLYPHLKLISETVSVVSISIRVA